MRTALQPQADCANSVRIHAMTDPLPEHDARDRLFAEPLDAIAGFVFDDAVASVFPDMIRRSVPGYATIVTNTGLLAERYATPGSRCYDLGCSLGASTVAMASALRDRDCTLIGVDNSAAMLTRCRQHLDTAGINAELRCDNIEHTDISDASVVVMNFTLQFIAPNQRMSLMQRIYSGMRPGGVLVLSEKIRFEDPHLQDLNTELHHNFKAAHGYSDLEISQKRSALENVLVPETIETHRQRLTGAGFASVDVWFQCFNFVSMVAVR